MACNLQVASLPASEKGQFSANSLEDDFASKITLTTGIENTMEEEEEFNWESSDEDDEMMGLSCCRIVIEDGEEVLLPAEQYYIYLKEGPPEGCDRRTYHLNILKQVVGSDAEEVYTEVLRDTLLVAVLTEEERDKLSDIEQVAKSALAECM